VEPGLSGSESERVMGSIVAGQAEEVSRDIQIGGEGIGPMICHLDMDSFFAAVEELDQPGLAGKPVLVGGVGARGVVASCNYQARRFGVHSAMPMSRAQRLCPEAVVLGPRHDRYRRVSAELMTILRDVTPLVEPVGLDEAFLDLTGSRRRLGLGSPFAVGRWLRQTVVAKLGLGCSVGIGRSKLVAKLASRMAKPRVEAGKVLPGNGVLAVTAAQEPAFLSPLSVRVLPGVGPATAARLEALGIRTLEELASAPESILRRQLGRATATALIRLAAGRDDRPVRGDRAPRSVGHEETFPCDLYDRTLIEQRLVPMAEAVAAALEADARTARTISIKVRFADFRTITRSRSLHVGVATSREVALTAVALLRGVNLHGGVRLVGVSASGLVSTESGRQLALELWSLPGPPSGREEDALELSKLEAWTGVSAALSAVRAKFGQEAIGLASRL